MANIKNIEVELIADFTGEFPIARNALIGTVNEKYLKKLDKHIEKIKQAIEEKEVLSTDFANIKSAANYFVDAAYETYVDSVYLHAGKYVNVPNDLYMLTSPRDANSINSYSKKLIKLSETTKDTPMYQATRELTEQLLELYNVMQFLKQHMVKASDKKKEVKNEQEEWLKKLINHKDSQKVISLLKNTASNIEETLYGNYLQYLNSIVDKYKQSVDNGQSDYTKVFSKNMFARMTIQQITKRILAPGESTYKETGKPKTFVIVDNHQEIIEKESRRMAAEIVNQFVYKNSSKLSYIIYNKNNLNEVSIKNVNLGMGYIECDVECKFQDSSEFIANTSVVLSHSKFGLPFYRYPTLFRGVKMPDGSNLTGISEQKMDEVFALANVENTKEVMEDKIKRLKMK